MSKRRRMHIACPKRAMVVSDPAVKLMQPRSGRDLKVRPLVIAINRAYLPTSSERKRAREARKEAFIDIDVAIQERKSASVKRRKEKDLGDVEGKRKKVDFLRVRWRTRSDCLMLRKYEKPAFLFANTSPRLKSRVEESPYPEARKMQLGEKTRRNPRRFLPLPHPHHFAPVQGEI